MTTVKINRGPLWRITLELALEHETITASTEFRAKDISAVLDDRGSAFDRLELDEGVEDRLQKLIEEEPDSVRGLAFRIERV
jgi:hypothetical protein